MERVTRRRVEETSAVPTTPTAVDASLLASVRVLCRECSCVGALPHVAEKLSAFLDYSRFWTPMKAANIGSMRLLTRVLEASERDSSLSPERKLQQYREVTKIAMGRRWFAAVQLLYGYDPRVLTTKEAAVAAVAGDLVILEWVNACDPTILPDRDHQIDKLAFHLAAAYGQMDTVKWLVETFPDTPRYLGPAAASGNLELVQWLHEHADCDSTHTPVIEPRFNMCYRSGLRYRNRSSKATNRPKRVLRQFVSIRPPQDTDAIDWAARGGHLEVVQWLHANRQDGCTTKALDSAAARGHLAVVQWLHENRTEGCTTGALDQAATNGHAEVVQWLGTHRNEGCTSSGVNAAVAAGNLGILQLLDLHCSEGWGPEAMDRAAQRGQLEVVKWLHEKRSEGCSTKAMDEAAINGHLDTVKWLHENRSEGCTSRAMDKAAERGDLETVKWLHANRSEGCTTYAMDKAAENGHLETVKWLHENRGEGCTTLAMNGAATRGHLAVVQFLHRNRQEGGTYHAYYYARMRGYKEVVAWLEETHAVPLVGTDPVARVARCCMIGMRSWSEAGL